MLTFLALFCALIPFEFAHVKSKTSVLEQWTALPPVPHLLVLPLSTLASKDARSSLSDGLMAEEEEPRVLFTAGL